DCRCEIALAGGSVTASPATWTEGMVVSGTPEEIVELLGEPDATGRQRAAGLGVGVRRRPTGECDGGGGHRAARGPRACELDRASRGRSRAGGDGFWRVWRSYLLKADSTWGPALTQRLRRTSPALLPLYDQCHTRWLTDVTPSAQARP